MRRECRGRFPRHWFQRKLLVSDPGMQHGTCVTHVSWCMSGSLTRAGGEKRSRHSRRMRNLQFYISGKRPMAETTIGVPYLKVKSLQLIWRSGTRRWNLRVLDLQMSGGWSLLRADRPDLWLYPQMKQHFFLSLPAIPNHMLYGIATRYLYRVIYDTTASCTHGKVLGSFQISIEKRMSVKYRNFWILWVRVFGLAERILSRIL